MRSTFHAFNPDENKITKETWGRSLIVFDTSALLDLFRYPLDVRDDVLEILENNETDLWIPHQVGLEFSRNWHRVKNDQSQLKAKITSELKAMGSGLKSVISKLLQHYGGSSGSLNGVVDKHVLGLSDEIISLYVSKAPTSDDQLKTYGLIVDLFEGRVGERFGYQKQLNVIQDARARYELGIPPGYCDRMKSQNKYGDVITWIQLLEHSNATGKPVVFVTSDGTRDWWEPHGKSPRQELIDEYAESTGMTIHILDMPQFLAGAKEVGLPVSPETFDGVETVTDRLRREIREFKATPVYDAPTQTLGEWALERSGIRESTETMVAGLSRYLPPVDSGVMDAINRHLLDSDLFKSTSDSIGRAIGQMPYGLGYLDESDDSDDVENED